MTTQHLPTLFGKNKQGGYKIWSTWVEDTGEVFVCTQYGQYQGAQQISRKKVTGKNKGRSNETSDWEQGLNEAQTLWNKKYDQNYRESVEELENVPMLPMLAHKYKDHKNKVAFPAVAQPKLNGVRCIVTKKNDQILYTSRLGKPFQTLEHLTPTFDAILNEGEKIDGEMYYHGLTFENIIRRLKRVLTDRSDLEDIQLEYHAFDFVDEQQEQPFHQRFATLQDRFVSLVSFSPQPISLVKIVDSFRVENEERLMTLHKIFIEDGYEGTIIRNRNGMYLPDYRSYDLLKLKDFHDDEFEIVDFTEGQGREEGAIIFICKTKEGKTFNVRPRGTLHFRNQMYIDACANPSKFVGHNLTVRYQNLSEDQVPIFGVGLAVRNYE